MSADLHSEKTITEIGAILERKKSVARLVASTASALQHAYDMRTSKSPADLIFDLVKLPDSEEGSVTRLIRVLRSFGIQEDDPRLAEMLNTYREFEQKQEECEERGDLTLPPKEGYNMNRRAFRDCIRPAVDLITQALRSHLIIPNWPDFALNVEKIFKKCKCITSGEVATYIPQLKRQNPNLWGCAICTIDGQRLAFGDSKYEFCLQSVSKAFNYAIVASDLGGDLVHSFVGQEPSGRSFNDICLDQSGKPHNPMINAGAIVTTSLIKKGEALADRYDFVLNEYKKLAGGAHVGFNNATFLSERDTADRNYALSFYMKEYNCFPPGTATIREELDLYFQLCSLETSCETLAVMAATLANGGLCPLTDERCVMPEPCRNVLSLMYSCGMYDLSGKFAFQVGLPAKSGVSGALIVVVPNVMGICLFSPPLDKTGNSSRGVAFCKELIGTFSFHNYDSLLHADNQKVDPRRKVKDRETEAVVSLLFAAKSGDMEIIKRSFLQGNDLEVADYDGRTALHVAASEGCTTVVRFLLRTAGVDPNKKDRWDRTAYDDAMKFNHERCARVLKKHMDARAGRGIITIEEDDYSSGSEDEDCRRWRIRKESRKEKKESKNSENVKFSCGDAD